METRTLAASEIQHLLTLQSSAGRPSAQICGVIAGLKDLCEVQTGGGGVDWRRGPSGGGGGARTGGGGGFRTGVGGASAGNGSLPRGRGGPLQRGNGNHHQHMQSGGGGGGSGSGGYSRYQSKFRNSSQAVEDKILNNIILSKLNKFSGSTYDEIRDFLYQILGSGEPDLADMIRHFMMLVFKKAATEEVYCPLYAKLLAEISSRYKVILEEMKKLQANYLEIFDEIEEVPEGGEDYEAFVIKKKEKTYRQGYSQFLAELAGLEILELSNLALTFEKLFTLTLQYGAQPEKKSVIDDYTDCLVRMSRVLKKKSSPFFVDARATLWRQSKDAIETLLTKKENYPSLTPKSRFLLMDVKDNLSH